MCIDILKDPVKAIISAKKKNQNRTWLVLIEACIFFGLASGVLFARGGSFSDVALRVAAISAGSVFVTVLVISIVLGYVLKIIATNLGGSGQYYEGLTAVSYSLIPISVSVFIAALLSAIPGGILLSSLALALGFACGVSLLYRAVKELFKTDMVVSLIAVSVLIIVIFVAASVSTGLATVANIGALLPVP